MPANFKNRTVWTWRHNFDVLRGTLPFRNLTVDHVVPRSKGSDHRDNLQLCLCGACNSLKGSGSHAELLVKLARE